MKLPRFFQTSSLNESKSVFVNEQKHTDTDVDLEQYLQRIQEEKPDHPRRYGGLSVSFIFKILALLLGITLFYLVFWRDSFGLFTSNEVINDFDTLNILHGSNSSLVPQAFMNNQIDRFNILTGNDTSDITNNCIILKKQWDCVTGGEKFLDTWLFIAIIFIVLPFALALLSEGRVCDGDGGVVVLISIAIALFPISLSILLIGGLVKCAEALFGCNKPDGDIPPPIPTPLPDEIKKELEKAYCQQCPDMEIKNSDDIQVTTVLSPKDENSSTGSAAQVIEQEEKIPTHHSILDNKINSGIEMIIPMSRQKYSSAINTIGFFNNSTHQRTYPHGPYGEEKYPEQEIKTDVLQKGGSGSYLAHSQANDKRDPSI